MFGWFLPTIILAVFHASSAASVTSTGGPAGCVAFDINWNLLAFGFNGKDYNAGTQDTWSSSTGVVSLFSARQQNDVESIL